MILFVTTACIIGTVMFIMAIGVIVGNRELKGSCGGPNGCEICLLKYGRKGQCDRSCEDAEEHPDECGLSANSGPTSAVSDVRVAE